MSLDYLTQTLSKGKLCRNLNPTGESPAGVFPTVVMMCWSTPESDWTGQRVVLTCVHQNMVPGTFVAQIPFTTSFPQENLLEKVCVVFSFFKYRFLFVCFYSVCSLGNKRCSYFLSNIGRESNLVSTSANLRDCWLNETNWHNPADKSLSTRINENQRAKLLTPVLPSSTSQFFLCLLICPSYHRFITFSIKIHLRNH